MERERNEQGQYVKTIPLEGVLDVVRSSEGPVVTANDVADALECSGEAARRKLNQLEEQDTLSRRKVGGTAVVYWISDEDEPMPVNPSDPIFDRTTFTAGEPTDTSERVDEFIARAAAEDAHGEQ
jgi:predicted ArsR family transcriptional regulator